jgi:Leucine-rich repeat (LRR) protein
MEWKLQDFQNWFNDGCCLNIAKCVKRLNISRNELTEIPKEIKHMVNLELIDCSRNKIQVIPKELCKLNNLQIFDCRENNISIIPREICLLSNLNYFVCSNNEITELPAEMGNNFNLRCIECNNNKIKDIPKELGNLDKLEIFYFRNNLVQHLPKEIGQLSNLQFLDCDNNCIKDLPEEICKMIKLKHFFCKNNRIKVLPKNIGKLVNLVFLYCDNNEIQNLPIELTDCIKLLVCTYIGNPIEYIHPQVMRFINKNEFIQKFEQQIYSDKQSVHNHKIQECVRKSIEYIMSLKPTLINLREHINNNNLLEEKSKKILFKYCNEKTQHSVLNITFEELLISVYDFILKHNHKDEIFKILNNEILDSQEKCFTGRISRLINALNGFDENIIINISDSEQISNIFIAVKQKLKDEYSDELFKETIKKELQERNYKDEIIQEWIEQI